MPWACASASIFSALRPIRIGSGITRSPLASATPPWSRIATIERIRCWFRPMRPVTPCMMSPSRCVAMVAFLCWAAHRAARQIGGGAEASAGSSGQSSASHNAAQIADRERGGAGPVGAVVERLDGDHAAVALALQRCEDRRELQLALARAAPVRVVDLHVRDQPGRQPAVDQRGHRLGLAQRRGAAVDHRAQVRLADRAHQLRRFVDGVDQLGFAPRQRLDAVGDPVRRGDRGDAPQCIGEALERDGAGLAGGDAALLRRAVHQHRAAELGAQRGEPRHDLEGAAHAAPDRDRSTTARPASPAASAAR